MKMDNAVQCLKIGQKTCNHVYDNKFPLFFNNIRFLVREITRTINVQ